MTAECFIGWECTTKEDRTALKVHFYSERQM